MSEEQQYHEGGDAEKSSSLARLLLGKVTAHKLFSDQVLMWLLIGVSFLLPLFFVPGQIATPEFAKILLLEAVVLFGVFAWAMGRLRDGHVDFPKSLLLLFSFLLAIQFFIAAVFSPAPLVSFIGTGYDIGTVNIFVVLFLAMFLSSVVFRDRDRVLMLFAGFMLSGIIAMIFHFLRHVVGADFLDFGIFTSAVTTPVGKWNDFAALVGGVLVLTLSTLYFFPENKALRIPAGVIFLLGLFFLVVVDFTVLWMILAVILGALTVLSVYEGERAHRIALREAEQSGAHHAHKPLHRRIVRHLPFLAVVLFAVSVVYISGLSTLPWGSNNVTIASTVARALHASPYSEVVLTPKTTFEIVKATIEDSPFFGSGPNRFGSSFLLHKTSEMNRTPFWDSSFDYGLGRIPTYFGTTGLIGMFLWVLFIGVLLLKSRKIFRLFEKDRIAAYLAFVLFIMTLYFWGLAFFYLPNIAIFTLAFIFTGALIAFLVSEGVLGVYRITFSSSRLGMVVTPVVVVVLVGVVASGVLLYRQVSSLVAFREAQLSLNAGNLDGAEASLLRAKNLSQHDIYYRTLSNIALVRLTQLGGAKQEPTPEFQQRVEGLITDAQDNARRAVAIDPTNFENYLQLGGVFDTLGSLGIQNTAQPARENYEQALRLNPKSPRVLFVLSRLEYISGDQVKAKEYLARALVERPNYLEAISFYVQLSLQEKKVDEALGVLANGVMAEPTNFLLRFALGYLLYSNGAYAEAIPQFEAAVMLNPVYSDAKYFLGLSYAKLDRINDAILQFSDIQTLNPDNKDVINVLDNLKAGRDPFAPPFTAPTEQLSDALSELDNGEGSSSEE
jgi:tetratricopeptide (TPR) repeat protein